MIIGSVVKHKADNLKMVVENIYLEDFSDITGIASKGDLDCAYWEDNRIKFKTVTPSTVELIQVSKNEELHLGDVVMLKSGSKNFVINEDLGSEICLEGLSGEYNKVIFKKVNDSLLDKIKKLIK